MHQLNFEDIILHVCKLMHVLTKMGMTFDCFVFSTARNIQGHQLQKVYNMLNRAP